MAVLRTTRRALTARNPQRVWNIGLAPPAWVPEPRQKAPCAFVAVPVKALPLGQEPRRSSRSQRMKRCWSYSDAAKLCTEHTAGTDDDAQQQDQDGPGELPLVAAASWLGARRSPFSKYLDLWRGLDAPQVMELRPPLPYLMFPPLGKLEARSSAKQLVRAAQARPGAPIVVHLFSGGGFIFMGWVFRALHKMQSPEASDVLARVRGIILDSSPAVINPDVSARALVAAALAQPAEGIERRLALIVRPTQFIVRNYLKLPFISSTIGQEAVAKTWEKYAPTCPLLFLYSDADVLIRPEVVQGYMQQVRERGGCVYSYKWADSAHVEHYKAHPEQYKKQLGAFLQVVLGKRSAGEEEEQQQQGEKVGQKKGALKSGGEGRGPEIVVHARGDED